MLLLEIGRPELHVTKHIFYAPCGARILAMYIGEFGSGFLMFETFEMRTFGDMALPWLLGSNTFEFFPIWISGMRATFSHRNPRLSHHASISPGY
jgi:hypothetical protein